MNLNNIQLKDFMCGCLLGNSNLSKKYQNSIFYEYTPERRKEYLLWKMRTIEHNLDTEFIYKEHIHNGTICGIQSRTHKYFTKLYDTFYQDGRKTFPFRFVNKYFDDIGLSVLYMDCGHTSWRRQYGTIKMCEIAPMSLTE